jgi:conjugative transfer signal peptidase TraF
LVILALLATLVWRPPVLLLWNASASSPLGLYRVTPASDLRTGDMAAAWLPEGARELATKRDYLPRDVPLVKHVAATTGDRVCAAANRILVNGKVKAVRRSADLSGRPLPWWHGCRRLGTGEVFLLSPDVPDAYDGRYFGITRRGETIGKAMLLWRR